VLASLQPAAPQRRKIHQSGWEDLEARLPGDKIAKNSLTGLSPTHKLTRLFDKVEGTLNEIKKIQFYHHAQAGR
jgi:hypothetical protein